MGKNTVPNVKTPAQIPNMGESSRPGPNGISGFTPMSPAAQMLIRRSMTSAPPHERKKLQKQSDADARLYLIWTKRMESTPKHGSWLDIAEIELNVMTRQRLSRRIAEIDLLRSELSIWEAERNTSAAKVNRHFRTSDARIKLSSLYPGFTTS
jgi:hypothetical protein